jgi:hypothetical protein
MASMTVVVGEVSVICVTSAMQLSMMTMMMTTMTMMMMMITLMVMMTETET